jgi:hypothetical protein
MKVFGTLEDGLRWFEIETAQEALAVANPEASTFGIFFALERRQGGTGRYFVLQTMENAPLAFCRIPPPLETRRPTGELLGAFMKPMVVGRRDVCPFPAFGSAIRGLSQMLDIPLDETCYPYAESRAPQMKVEAGNRGRITFGRFIIRDRQLALSMALQNEINEANYPNVQEVTAQATKSTGADDFPSVDELDTPHV